MAGRWKDDAIAIQLNLLGWRTGTGNHWTRLRVRELRGRLDLPACVPTQPAWLTACGCGWRSSSCFMSCSLARKFVRRKRSNAVGRCTKPCTDASARTRSVPNRGTPSLLASLAGIAIVHQERIR